MTYQEVSDFVLALSPHDVDNLMALSSLGRAKCEELLAVARRNNDAGQIKFAQVALFLARIGANDAEVR